MDEKFDGLLKSEEFQAKLIACEEPEQVQELFAAEGIDVTLSDVKALAAELRTYMSESDELDEDTLDTVAGGRSFGDPVPASVKNSPTWQTFLDRMHCVAKGYTVGDVLAKGYRRGLSFFSRW